ncbi:hypothetical protein FHT82_000841 [Rhizobium sp. BK275]|uniref:hypothetical protein n=1 Tax=unclassified Rhizobium TaxID=2613769 RepID=UPI001611A729|nr:MULTISPECIES: hypothetical protein [unclassified Rhizobium]MBB3388121.1 hypothetical protein [Rhizobium sp. BK275]MBB3407473.1 hypothetical protein [Rhizobium sp. BK316]
MKEPSPYPEASVYNWLGEHVRSFVRLWRRFDARLNRPLPKGRRLAWRWLAPDGGVAALSRHAHGCARIIPLH